MMDITNILNKYNSRPNLTSQEHRKARDAGIPFEELKDIDKNYYLEIYDRLINKKNSAPISKLQKEYLIYICEELKQNIDIDSFTKNKTFGDGVKIIREIEKELPEDLVDEKYLKEILFLEKQNATMKKLRNKKE